MPRLQLLAAFCSLVQLLGGSLMNCVEFCWEMSGKCETWVIYSYTRTHYMNISISIYPIINMGDRHSLQAEE